MLVVVCNLQMHMLYHQDILLDRNVYHIVYLTFG